MSDLASRHCKPIRGTAALDREEAERLLRELEGWLLEPDGLAIVRRFSFADFHRTMAFVNAVAWVAHREDHHPDLEVGYNRCSVRYSTHDVGGLSENDFVCAAKIDALSR